MHSDTATQPRTEEDMSLKSSSSDPHGESAGISQGVSSLSTLSTSTRRVVSTDLRFQRGGGSNSAIIKELSAQVAVGSP